MQTHLNVLYSTRLTAINRNIQQPESETQNTHTG